jgi:hypothetical protein
MTIGTIDIQTAYHLRTEAHEFARQCESELTVARQTGAPDWKIKGLEEAVADAHDTFLHLGRAVDYCDYLSRCQVGKPDWKLKSLEEAVAAALNATQDLIQAIANCDHQKRVFDTRQAITGAATLDDLCAALNTAGEQYLELHIRSSEMPKFGGERPAPSPCQKPYSWDETRVLVWDNQGNLGSRGAGATWAIKPRS